MIDYKAAQEWVLESVSFRYLEGLYQGPGLLEWNPDKGFRLNAFVKRSGPPLPTRIGFGISGTLRKRDFGSIRMRLQRRNQRALARWVPLVDRMDVVMENHLSVDLSNILFFSPSNRPSEIKGVTGDCLYYGVQNRPVFPDSVENTRMIEGEPAYSGMSRSAIVFQGDDLMARGERTTDSYLRMDWFACGEAWSTKVCWEWTETFAQALSIISGYTLQTVKRDVDDGRCRRIELFKKVEPTSFGPLSPFEMIVLDKDFLFDLAEFLVRGGVKPKICLRIYAQIAEAARQQTMQAVELLQATILEAALRTLYDQPFILGRRGTWKADECMKRFREDYLSPEWEEPCKRVLDTWKRLRHRNAHPDWLVSDTWNDDRNVKFSRDIKYLSRFYGAMILALMDRRPDISQLRIETAPPEEVSQ